MDLIHVWHGDRYWSFHSQEHDPKVKVTDLEFLCKL